MIRLAVPLADHRTGLTTLLRWVGCAVLAGAILAALGPFGSYRNGGPAILAIFWIASTVLGLLIYGSTALLVSRAVPVRSPLIWPALIGVALIASIPEALATRAGALWLWPNLAEERLSLATWFSQTLLIAVVMVFAFHLLSRRAAPVTNDAPALPNVKVAKELPRDVLALQMEDHYVRLHRPTGSDLMLMPLGDAIAGLKVEGLRIHRSWWVARHAVTAIEGNARSMKVHLSNDITAPVARSAVVHLKTAGWLEDSSGGHGT
jgi:hypothetical protein